MSCYTCDAVIAFNQAPSSGGNTPFEYAILACGEYLQADETTFNSSFYKFAVVSPLTETAEIAAGGGNTGNSIYSLDIQTLTLPSGCSEVEIKQYNAIGVNIANACGCLVVPTDAVETVKVQLTAVYNPAAYPPQDVPIFVHDGTGLGVTGLAGNATVFDGGAGPNLATVTGSQDGWYRVSLTAVQVASAEVHFLDYDSGGNVSSGTVITVETSLSDSVADSVWHAATNLDAFGGAWTAGSFGTCACDVGLMGIDDVPGTTGGSGTGGVKTVIEVLACACTGGGGTCLAGDDDVPGTTGGSGTAGAQTVLEALAFQSDFSCLADTVLRRSGAAAEASSCGDAHAGRNLLGMLSLTTQEFCTYPGPDGSTLVDIKSMVTPTESVGDPVVICQQTPCCAEAPYPATTTINNPCCTS
jgi:hypothetical protein